MTTHSNEFHQEILFFSLEDALNKRSRQQKNKEQLPASPAYLEQIPNTFSNYEDYKNIFQPLLIEEFCAQLLDTTNKAGGKWKGNTKIQAKCFAAPEKKHGFLYATFSAEIKAASDKKKSPSAAAPLLSQPFSDWEKDDLLVISRQPIPEHVFDNSAISTSSFQSPPLPPHILGLLKQKIQKQNAGVVVIEVKLLNPPSSQEGENSASTALSALSRRRTEMGSIIAEIEKDAQPKQEDGDEEEGSVKELEVWHVQRLCNIITQTREYDALCGLKNFSLKENVLSPIDRQEVI